MTLMVSHYNTDFNSVDNITDARGFVKFFLQKSFGYAKNPAETVCGVIYDRCPTLWTPNHNNQLCYFVNPIPSTEFSLAGQLSTEKLTIHMDIRILCEN